MCGILSQFKLFPPLLSRKDAEFAEEIGDLFIIFSYFLLYLALSLRPLRLCASARGLLILFLCF